MNTNYSPVWKQKKYVYIFILLLVLVQINNLQPLSGLKTNSVEYLIHMVITGLLFWIFAAILLYTAWTYLTKPNPWYGLVGGIFGVMGILMLALPFLIAYEMSNLDHAIEVLNARAASLRALGK